MGEVLMMLSSIRIGSAYSVSRGISGSALGELSLVHICSKSVFYFPMACLLPLNFFWILGPVSGSKYVFFIGFKVVITAWAPAHGRGSALHLSWHQVSATNSTDGLNRDSAIVGCNTRALGRGSVALLGMDYTFNADLVHKVVSASAMDRFPDSEGRGVLVLHYSNCWFNAILTESRVVCIDPQGSGTGWEFPYVNGGVLVGYILRAAATLIYSW